MTAADHPSGPQHPAPRRPPPMFVADHPALDFLNTYATPHGRPVEWLANGADLLAWMEQGGLLPPEFAAAHRANPAASSTLDTVADNARALRDWLRGFVQRHAGLPLQPEAATELGPLNLLLAKDTSYARIEAIDGTQALHLRRLQRWDAPEEMLQPLAAVIADLVCHADFRLIRHCAGDDCALYFLDRTKAHARRWCSMATCGNRAKAAAHRARRAER